MADKCSQPDFRDGIMACMRPNDPERFSCEGGTPPEDVHLTLAYFGKTEEWDSSSQDQISEVLGSEIARDFAPLEGMVTGITTFSAPEGEDRALVLLIDAPGLGELRATMVQRLRAALEEGQGPRSNHDFMAHMTVCYGADEDQQAFAESLVGQGVRFEAIELVWGMEAGSWALEGDRGEVIPDLEASIGLPLTNDNVSSTAISDAGAFADSEAREATPMPYSIDENNPECSESEPYAVVKDDDGALMGCHASRDEAEAQIAALYAAEEADEEEDDVEASAEAPLEASLEDRLAAVEQFVAATNDSAAGGGEEVDEEAEETVEDVVEASVEGEEEVEETEAHMSAEGTLECRALPSHSSATVDPPTFKDWSGNVAQKRTRSGETAAYYGKIYAWQDPNEDPGHKTAYKFPHHAVGVDGQPGAAVMWAVHASIGMIDDSTIPKADYRGVYNHLAKHLRDGGIEDIPELGSDTASIEEVEAAIGEMRSRFLAMCVETPEEMSVEEPQAPMAGLATAGDLDLVSEVVRRWLESVSTPTTTSVEVVEELSSEEDEGADETLEASTEEASADDSEECAEKVGEFAEGDFDWEGVLIVEGTPSGDRRMIEEGSLTWRDLPLPLMLQTINAEGHSGAVIAGSIHEIERAGQNIIGRGYFDSGSNGQEARRLLEEGTMRGVSADIDSVVMTLQDQKGNEIDPADVLYGDTPRSQVLEVLVAGRLMGATMTPFPAFQEAHLTVISPEEQAEDLVLVASGAEVLGEVWRIDSPYPLVLRGQEPVELETIVASAAVIELPVIPVNPPLDWFSIGEMEEPQPLTVYPDGRIYGLVAEWGTCHIGFRDRCVTVPRTHEGYRFFRNKSTLTAEGELVATGPIYMDTVHPDLRMQASDAQAFYAHTGCAVADVALYENEFGIVAAGAVRPDAAPEDIRALRGSDVSPDWRPMSGNLEVVGLLAVNVSGFITKGLAASAGDAERMAADILQPRALFNSVTGEIEALVAAGIPAECSHCGQESIGADALVALVEMVNAQKARIDELTEIVRPYRVERMAQRVAAMALSPEGEALDAGVIDTVTPEG